MKIIIYVILIVLFSNLQLFSQNTQKQWMKYSLPEEAGFSSEKLKITKNYFDSTNAVAMLLIKDGHIVEAWGDIERRYKLHSVRKTLLNALYGIQIKKGVIDINKTIGELGIKEKVELTDMEKSAKIKHLLATRSGIYLNAALQPDVGGSPKRGSLNPGEYQYYNNWDFNVLGTIYNLETNSDIFKDFNSDIAIPLGMEDYRIFDGTYEYSDVSIHPGYPLKMSSRDLAKFGQLFLQMGNWDGKQIIDSSWIQQSLTPYTVADNMGNGATGYGYLWWLQQRTNESKRYFALGWGEQYLGIFPDENIIIILRADSYFGHYFVEKNRKTLIKMILDAMVSNSSKNKTLTKFESQGNTIKPINLTKEQLLKYTGTFQLAEKGISEINQNFSIKYSNNGLMIEDLHYAYKFKLVPLSEAEFFIEDLELFLTFETDISNRILYTRILKNR
ncbi:serine hydrolase [Ancylomarina sp. YFZ004]